ncbi:MAG TPA: PEP-CTERM sorting domain-containing protein [Gammaproteobacteria bacterium]|nr:PEP-CTERM sorting domain-containing protein [Gammaproteobacteria bacterium]
MRKTLHVSVAALFGALGISSTAHAISSSLSCPEPVSGGFQTSAVPSSVTDLGTGNFLYEFVVCNTSDITSENARQVIRDWELPFFGSTVDYARDDEGNPIFDQRGNPVLAGTDPSKIVNVTVPEGWSFAIEEIGPENVSTGWSGIAEWQQDGDPWKDFFDDLFGGEDNNPYNDVTHVLHFYTGFCEGGESGFDCFGGNTIREGEGLGGFGFESPFGTFNAPYQASWEDLPVRTGDPDFPLTGPTNQVIEDACAATNDNCGRTSTVPEPGSLALLGLGLGALAHSRRQRKGKLA